MIVGIDLSSRSVAMCGLPTALDDRFFLKKFAVHAKVRDRAEIVYALTEFIQAQVFPEDRVYVEAPVLAGAKNIQSTIKVAAAYGAVLSAVKGQHASAIEVAISSWKLATVGKGNASKDDVSAWLHAQHPHVYTECAGDQDLKDAVCIALFAETQERSDVAGARERRLLHQAS